MVLLLKIKDRILLGILAGVICGIPGRVTNAIQYNKKLTDVKYGQMSANLFLPSSKVNTTEGRIVSSLVNNTMISITGILTTYVLSITGRDKAIVKGMGVVTSMWVAIYGLTARLGLSIKSKKPLGPILSYIDHAIFGALCGLFVSKFGDDSLFPDVKIKPEEKLPLAFTSDSKIPKHPSSLK